MHIKHRESRKMKNRINMYQTNKTRKHKTLEIGGWSQDGSVSRTVGISSPKHIFLKIQQMQLILKERTEDTGQQPDYNHTC